MRKKINPTENRNNIIGIKVKIETRNKLEYIADREGKTLSTYINDVLTKNIEDYLSIAKINWDELSPEEKGEAK